MAISSALSSDRIWAAIEELKSLLRVLFKPEVLKLAAKIIVPGYVVYVLGAGVYNRYFHRLRHFPGPFWASVTPLWYFQVIRHGRAYKVQSQLHEKYGDFVRIAPNMIAIADPAAIETVYGPNSKNKDGKYWRKGKFYDGFDPHIPGARTDSFSERDNARHADRRRLIAHLYTQGNILNYEPCVDRIIDLLCARMETFASSGRPTAIDMATWINRYTFDVIGEIYYGREGGFGMIRDDVDYNDWCHLMEIMPNIGAAITYMPYGFQTLYMISQVLVSDSSRAALRGMVDVVRQANKAARERWETMQMRTTKPTPTATGEQGKERESSEYRKHDNKNDMLTGLLEIVRDKGGQVGWTVADVATEAWAVIWAGSDTTGTALTAVFYFLHKNPDKLATLRREIDTAFDEGRLSHPIRFSDARRLVYLHAVILESMRLHPSLGLGLPREVPEGGAEVVGTFIPGGNGIEVSLNAKSLGQNRAIFGDDCADFEPDRWLRVSEEHAGLMERSTLQFGHGPRVCIGRHITSIEMYKMIPAILRRFEFEMVVDEWVVNDGWFKAQSKVMVKVHNRTIQGR